MYFLLIVDNYSCFMWAAVFKHKAEAFKAFEKFKGLDKVEKSLKVDTFKTDKGGEFNCIKLSNFCN